MNDRETPFSGVTEAAPTASFCASLLLVSGVFLFFKLRF